jgi:hypothetical protein
MALSGRGTAPKPKEMRDMSKFAGFADQDLNQIVDHPYVRKYKGNDINRPGCAGLWAMRQAPIMDDDVRRLLSYAHKEDATPSDLRALIAAFLQKRFASLEVPPPVVRTDLRVYEARRFAKRILEVAMQQLHDLGTPPAAVVTHAVNYFALEPNDDLIALIQEIQADEDGGEVEEEKPKNYSHGVN